MKEKRIIIIYGPTASGKTDLSLSIADYLGGQIINADVGQFYAPLSIGTAKPAWQDEKVPHHLFDIVKKPHGISVVQYRKEVILLLEQIWQKGDIPIIVGGSGFYLMSLFFPPIITEKEELKKEKLPELRSDWWQTLYEIDPERASQIHPQDTYRLQRALTLWQKTGIKPSACKPFCQPFADVIDFVLLESEGMLLRDRIEKRIDTMFEQGWIDETKKLHGTSWHNFLLKKKLLGYDDILQALDAQKMNQNKLDLHELKKKILQKTIAYAKRQRTFGKMMIKKIMESTAMIVHMYKYDVAQLSIEKVFKDLQSIDKQ